jgi:hypothetical protein
VVEKRATINNRVLRRVLATFIDRSGMAPDDAVGVLLSTAVTMLVELHGPVVAVNILLATQTAIIRRTTEKESPK